MSKPGYKRWLEEALYWIAILLLSALIFATVRMWTERRADLPTRYENVAALHETGKD